MQLDRHIPESFGVSGVNPGTGEIVQLSVYAETEMDAKAHAESCGLLHVVVQETASAVSMRRAVPIWLEESSAAVRG